MCFVWWLAVQAVQVGGGASTSRGDWHLTWALLEKWSCVCVSWVLGCISCWGIPMLHLFLPFEHWCQFSSSLGLKEESKTKATFPPFSFPLCAWLKQMVISFLMLWQFSSYNLKGMQICLPVHFWDSVDLLCPLLTWLHLLQTLYKLKGWGLQLSVKINSLVQCCRHQC